MALSNDQKNRWAWVFGLAVATLLLLALCFPVVAFPVIAQLFALLSPVALAIVAGFGGGPVGFICLSVIGIALPRVFLASFSIKDSVITAGVVAKSFAKALIFAGLMFAFSYFLAPLLIGFLAAQVPALGFLAAMSSGGTLSLIMVTFSSLSTLVSTLWKSPVKDMIANNPGRTAELVVAAIAIAGAVIFLTGVLAAGLTIAAPVSFAIGFTLAVIATFASLGFVTTCGPVIKEHLFNSNPTPPQPVPSNTNPNTPTPGSLPVPPNTNNFTPPTPPVITPTTPPPPFNPYTGGLPSTNPPTNPAYTGDTTP